MLSQSGACITGAGDVLIMSPHLHCIPDLFDIAKQTLRQAHLNVMWTLCYNCIALSLAMGLLEPWGLKISPYVFHLESY